MSYVALVPPCPNEPWTVSFRHSLWPRDLKRKTMRVMPKTRLDSPGHLTQPTHSPFLSYRKPWQMRCHPCHSKLLGKYQTSQIWIFSTLNHIFHPKSLKSSSSFSGGSCSFIEYNTKSDDLGKKQKSTRHDCESHLLTTVIT